MDRRGPNQAADAASFATTRSQSLKVRLARLAASVKISFSSAVTRIRRSLSLRSTFALRRLGAMCPL